MPLSEADKRRIEKEFEEEQHRKEEEQYRKELEAAAEAKEATRKIREEWTTFDSVAGYLVMAFAYAFIGLVLFALGSIIYTLVIQLLRWLGWMTPAAT